uniref:PP1-binding domain-containing protein n=1 Tax=Elaeophora elaphi TaxID=1147741 RepID=A0A0R3RXK7_9BILA
MCDDDSFNIATVPRHAVFGAQAGNDDGEDESTLGDRFFVCFQFDFNVIVDLLPLQTNTAAKADVGHRCKLIPSNTQHFEQIPMVTVTATAAITDTAKATAIGTTDVSTENIHDDAPFELNRLAMFRPSSRTRLSGCRSNTILREENTVHLSACTAELSCHENLGPNGCVDKETANYTSKISSSGLNQSSKTLRRSTSRPSYPTRVSRIQSTEMKQRMGSVTCQPTIKVRATSAEPRIQRPAMAFTRTSGSSIRKTTETAMQIPQRGPLRVRSASTSVTSTKNIGAKAENTVRSNEITTAQRQNKANLTRDVVSAERMVSKSETTRKSLYVGPETRARARMKQSNDNSEVRKITSSVSTPKRWLLMKSVHSRPLLQLNANIGRNATENTASLCSTKNAENDHISRPRIRAPHEPIRVRNTQGRVKGGDGLPPIESESRFRQSLTRRPKGGDSLDRGVTKAEGNENDEIWTVVAKKPEPVLEFASCLRSRVAAKKMQSTPIKSATQSTRPPKTRQSKHGGSDVLPVARRRTEAEREAFFRRLSTPKTIATIKKCTK